MIERDLAARRPAHASRRCATASRHRDACCADCGTANDRRALLQGVRTPCRRTAEHHALVSQPGPRDVYLGQCCGPAGRSARSLCATASSPPSVAGGVAQMPDPRAMSGHSMPAPELPDGTVTVRVVRDEMTNNIVGASVELHGAGAVRREPTGADGRALFTGVPAGARVHALAVVEGQRLESRPFDMPATGGVRTLLVAASAGAAPATPPSGGGELPLRQSRRRTGRPHARGQLAESRRSSRTTCCRCSTCSRLSTGRVRPSTPPSRSSSICLPGPRARPCSRARRRTPTPEARV